MVTMQSLRNAAKHVRMGVPRLRRLIEDGKLPAFKVGGTDDRPRLRVKLEDVERVVQQEMIYIPQKIKQQRHRRQTPKSAFVDPAFQDL